MALRKFILTQPQTTELRQAYERSKDGPTRTRLQAVRLYGSGYSIPQLQEITGCSRTSLMDWCRRYRAQGVAGLTDGRRGGNRAKLTPAQRQTVRANLHQYTPRQLFGPEAATPDGQFWTVPDLQRAVERWFGVTWDSPTSYVTLLSECGFSYQRTQKIYTSRRAADVLAFDEVLEKN
ncbi:MAG: helix-turn-helix domain-containing protein [Chloroflexota bacterium]|nr:helix-turn-helix domain-containing protein [Chloroflexota bacterium]